MLDIPSEHSVSWTEYDYLSVYQTEHSHILSSLFIIIIKTEF